MTPRPLELSARLRLRATVICPFVFAGFLLLAAACLHIPGWQTALNIPIISKTVRVTQLLDSTVFQVGPDSIMQFHFERNLDTIRVSEQLNIFQTTDTASLPLRAFVITPVAELRQALGASAVGGVTVPESGWVKVPPYQFQGQLTTTLTAIRQADLLTGVVSADVENLTRVRLDSVELTLPGGPPIEFGAIDSMSRVHLRAAVHQAALDSALHVTYRFVTSGSGQDSVLMFARDSLRMDVRIDSVRLRRGRIALTFQTEMSANRQNVDYIRLTTHRVGIDSLVLRSGTMAFNVDNTLPMPLDIRIIAPEAGFDSSFSVQGSEDVMFVRRLDGTTYRSQNPDSSKMTVNWFVSAVANGQTLSLDSGQGLVGRIDFETPAFNYMSGILYDTVWNTERTANLMPSFLPKFARLRFGHAWLELLMENAVGFNAALRARITAHNPAGESISVVGTASVGPGSPDVHATQQSELDIARLLDINPDRLSLAWRVGLTGRGQAWFESYGTGQASLMTPLRVAFAAETIEAGSWTIPIGPALRPSARQQLDTAQVICHFVNHLPLEIGARVRLSAPRGASAEVNCRVPKPRLDPLQRWVATPYDTVVSIQLSGAESQVFYSDSLRVRLQVTVPASDTVTVAGRDFFALKSSYGRLVVAFAPR